jgi:dTDP-4-dehydrorhamnose 3,5-epimerase-like enzyme
MKNIKNLSQRIEIIKRKKIEDSRGWFLKSITGTEKGLPSFTGEIYTVYSEGGASRGGHYHEKASEWFTLLSGTSELKLKDIQTNESISILISADEPSTILVPPNIAHRFDAIDNKPFLLLAYTNILYNPDDTIQLTF